VEVDAARLVRWCDGFAERHGEPVRVVRDGIALLLTGADGEVAQLLPPFPWPDRVTDPAAGATFLADLGRCAVLLVRRGGYACAVVDGERVTASKVGTRRVQGRTAAGGWSQQRFAHRRENQARELVQAAADVAARILLPVVFDWLVTGGDVALVTQALADPRLKHLADLPRGPHLAIGDPRADVVRAVPGQMRRLRIRLSS
jgi:hypothetical protein